MRVPLNLSARERVLVLAVHPDDESLGAGGLLQQARQASAAIRVLFVTDGDNNPWPQRYLERRWHVGPEGRERWGRRRRREALAALACLGITEDQAEFWALPDQGLTSIWIGGGGELISRLANEIRDWRPTILVGPCVLDRHPDHNAFALMLQMALARLRVADRDFVELEYLIHFGRTHPEGFTRFEVILTAEEQQAKRRAILSHATQMALSQRRFLAFARPTEEYFVASKLAGRKVIGQRQAVVCCVIPCYNVAAVCGEVVRETAGLAEHVIAVNDGSTDGTGQVLRQVAGGVPGRVHVLEFPKNRGKGAALIAAFGYALEHFSWDVLVTLDADRQHRPADIPKLATACAESGAGLVIGQRVQRRAMPWRSRLGNGLTAALLRRLYPAMPTDTQSGLRALDRAFVAKTVRSIKGRRYETELQTLLLALDQRRPVIGLPVPTLYFDGNRRSHFQPLRDSFRIYAALFRWWMRKRGGRPDQLAAR